MRAAIFASSALLLGLAGCGPGAPGSQGPHPVSEAVAVRIEPGGGLTIEIDGRATLALAPGAAPTARTFLEDWSGPLAIHEFQRSGEQSVALDRVAGVEVSTGSVRVRYRSADGARRGALTVAARSATTTGLRFELEGKHSARRGDFSVIYEIDESQRVATAIAIDHRSDVYRTH